MCSPIVKLLLRHFVLAVFQHQRIDLGLLGGELLAQGFNLLALCKVQFASARQSSRSAGNVGELLRHFSIMSYQPFIAETDLGELLSEGVDL